MTENPWLAAVWPWVRDQLGGGPLRVLEIGCGPEGGFVPALRAAGHSAVGVDPEAPSGPHFREVEFEWYDDSTPLDAVIACTSLHHVSDPHAVLDKVAALLRPSGTLVVVEWARERFDEPTARWAFDRLAPDGEGNWLHHHRERWRESSLAWDDYLAGWVAEHGLHRGDEIVAAIEARFRTGSRADAPYLFSDLDGVTETDEWAAVRAGEIRPTGLRWVGSARLEGEAQGSRGA